MTTDPPSPTQQRVDVQVGWLMRLGEVLHTLDVARADRDGWKVAYENLYELSSARMAALEGLLRDVEAAIGVWAHANSDGWQEDMWSEQDTIRAALAGSVARPAEEVADER